ncbi:dihydrofolate reductase [Sulfolobus acidocaldarius SUSAZ]|nr:dihydrofolate reductase [Sulfolobus acidocaldarius SUSAZ]
MSYDFEVDKIIEEIRKRSAKKVLLQFPEGIKPFSIGLLEKLRETAKDIEFIISSDASWGACDVAEDEARTLGVDLIVHFGHTPYTWYYPKFPTLFIELRSKLNVEEEQIEKLIQYINEKYNPRTVSLSSTIQHSHLLPKIKERMQSQFNVIIGKPSSPFMHDGQILGCDYKAVVNSSADVYVNVSGGLFHALGVGLTTRKPIVKLDPYTGKNEDLTNEIYKILKIRYGKIMKALDSRNWAIIQGVKTGQNRPLMVKYIQKKLEEKGYKVFVITNRSLSIDALRNIDNPEIDSFIVTSCPRLPIDDLFEYEKPVLTPGEAKMIIFSKLDEYIFPW